MKPMIHELNNLKYAVRYPDGFDSARKYPVLLYLHGAGGRDSDIDTFVSQSVFMNETALPGKYPFIVVMPHCPENTWFDMWEHLKALVREIAELPRTDRTRIYLTGTSMGGYACWQLGMSMPEYFAALAPVCGGGMYWNAPRLKDVPVWAFHGAKDTTVFPEESEKMVNAVNRAGGQARLTVYPDAAHDSWTATYSNPELYEWFLSHVNVRIPDSQF